MNAKEALKVSKDRSLNGIMEYIESQCREGRVVAKLWTERFWLSDENRRALLELGYTVDATGGYVNEWLVSWENVDA